MESLRKEIHLCLTDLSVPNHGVELEKTDEPRIWICPVSDARFECEVDTQEKETKFDIWGKAMQEWKVTSTGEE